MSTSARPHHHKPDKVPGPTPSDHPETTEVPDPDDADPGQIEQGKRASKDAKSGQVDTDCYNTSGNDSAPPKTSDRQPAERKPD